MRGKLYGYYQGEKKYILEDEEGSIKYELESGSSFSVDSTNFYCGETRAGKLFVAREGVPETCKGIEVLEDNTCYLMAKTMQTAKNCLLKEYKPIKSYDSLNRVLMYVDFIPQCVSTVYDLSEVEIISDYQSSCPNYTGDKEWYTYKCYTDSTDFTEVRVGNIICPTCPKYKTCINHQMRTYRAYYNGTYSILIKTNVRTGEKILQQIEITKSCDRNVVAKILMKEFTVTEKELSSVRKDETVMR